MKSEASEEVMRTPDEIREMMGKLTSSLPSATETERTAIMAAFATLGWVAFGGDNPLMVVLQKTKWDEVRAKENVNG